LSLGFFSYQVNIPFGFSPVFEGVDSLLLWKKEESKVGEQFKLLK